MKLMIASNSKHKVREIKEMLGGYYDEVLTLSEAGIHGDVVEDGETFLENATKKANGFRAMLADPTEYDVLADDSGLEVFALNGAPGVYSARYAGEHDDEANNAKLLRELDGVTDRRAAFVCVMVLIRHDGTVITHEGRCEGDILYSPRGTNGFGYDPLFRFEGSDVSFAEFTAEQKNAVSHRRRALAGILLALGE